MKTWREIFKGVRAQNEMQETAPCCGGNGHGHHHNAVREFSDAKIVYQCPMKCEGAKTYDAPGNCPVCNMHLAPVNK